MVEHVCGPKVPVARQKAGTEEPAETYEPPRLAYTAANNEVTVLQKKKKKEKVRTNTQGCLQTSTCVLAPT